jgi:phycoerythrin-associated linker protein
MNTTFITPVISRASELGVSLYEDTKPVELCFNDSAVEVETVILAVYRQVLGNAYVMESERLTVPESKLTEGKISVREFVRQVAKSELYQSRFFDNCPRYRSIELNFKHLLGRAPESYTEINAHSQILDQGGYDREIDSYLDSDEYQEKFGENIVPYYCGYKTQTGKNLVGFTHLFKLLRGSSSSDKNLTTKNSARLTNSLINNTPSGVVLPSNLNSYGGVTDIDKLLANALRPKTAPIDETVITYPIIFTQSSTGLEQKEQSQQQRIEKLQQKLAGLSSFASIGSSELNKWQSTGMSSGGSSDSPNSNKFRTTAIGEQNMQRQVEAQEQKIKDLEGRVADAQRLANIGEARLNKWRSRIFF